jgi:hypothetical protein
MPLFKPLLNVLECCKSSLDVVAVKSMHAGELDHSSLLTLRDYAAPVFGAKQPLRTIKRNLVMSFTYSTFLLPRDLQS